MITEKGTVENVSGQKARIRIEKSATCATCHSRDSCSEVSHKDMILEVTNALGATPGDRVEISIPSGSFLILSLLIYLLPVVSLIAGAFAGGVVARALGISPTSTSIAAGCLSMAAVFIALKRFDKSARAQKQFKPRMTRVLKASSPQPEKA